MLDIHTHLYYSPHEVSEGFLDAGVCANDFQASAHKTAAYDLSRQIVTKLSKFFLLGICGWSACEKEKICFHCPPHCGQPNQSACSTSVHPTVL